MVFIKRQGGSADWKDIPGVRYAADHLEAVHLITALVAQPE
jgi:ribosomal protein S12